MQFAAREPEFAVRDLSVLAYAGGFTHWLYRVERIPDLAVYDWNEANYFSAAADMFSIGDVITVSASGKDIGNGTRAMILAVDDITDGRVRMVSIGA